MATEIGVVNLLMGTVTAFSTDGSLRILKVGDSAYANDLILSGPDGAIEIRFLDGSVMDLGHDSQLLLNTDFFDLSLSGHSGDVSILVDADGDVILSGNEPLQNNANPAEQNGSWQHDLAGFGQSELSSLDLTDVLSQADNHIAGVEYEGHLQIQISNAEGLVQLINLTDVVATDDMAAQSLLTRILNAGDNSDVS